VLWGRGRRCDAAIYVHIFGIASAKSKSLRRRPSPRGRLAKTAPKQTSQDGAQANNSSPDCSQAIKSTSPDGAQAIKSTSQDGAQAITSTSQGGAQAKVKRSRRHPSPRGDSDGGRFYPGRSPCISHSSHHLRTNKRLTNNNNDDNQPTSQPANQPTN
jgi:hypothetical protein